MGNRGDTLRSHGRRRARRKDIRLMFIRKRKGGNQLLETYRENGKVRQRVICNLGHFESAEEALEAAELELAEHPATRFEDRLKSEYAYALEKWHEGEIPPLESVIEHARAALVTAADSEYARDFDGGWSLDLSDFVHEVRELEGLW